MRKLEAGLMTPDETEMTIHLETCVDKSGNVYICIRIAEKLKNDKYNNLKRIRVTKELSVGEESSVVENLLAVDLLAGMTVINLEKKDNHDAIKLGNKLDNMVRKAVKENNLKPYTTGVGARLSSKKKTGESDEQQIQPN